MARFSSCDGSTTTPPSSVKLACSLRTHNALAIWTVTLNLHLWPWVWDDLSSLQVLALLSVGARVSVFFSSVQVSYLSVFFLPSMLRGPSCILTFCQRTLIRQVKLALPLCPVLKRTCELALFGASLNIVCMIFYTFLGGPNFCVFLQICPGFLGDYFENCFAVQVPSLRFSGSSILTFVPLVPLIARPVQIA